MIKFNRKTDKVAIIAPASGCNDASGALDISKSNQRLKATIALFEENGFITSYDKNIFTKPNLPFFSSPKAERLKQAKEALEDPEVKIISALRGGYGCAEIAFDLMKIKPSGPKILIGFSDITTLHFLFNQHYGFPSIHGLFSESYQNMIPKMMELLSGSEASFALTPVNIDDKEISAQMAGGNLSIICNMIGTKLHPDFTGKIIFLEDINEKGYNIHRNLMHMHNACLFKGASAVIFGDFTESDIHMENSIHSFAKESLSNTATYKTNGLGHGRINRPLAIGGTGAINGNKLTVNSPFELI